MNTSAWAFFAAAVLLVAMSGPAFRDVRDASLTEIAALEEPRALSSFPFLAEIQPYLPPVVVDWMVAKRNDRLGLPSDARVVVDPQGELVVVWPDGCREHYSAARDGQRGPDCDGSRAEPKPDGPVPICSDARVTPEDRAAAGCPEPCLEPNGSQNTTSSYCIEPECPDGCPPPDPCAPNQAPPPPIHANNTSSTPSNGTNATDPSNQSAPESQPGTGNQTDPANPNAANETTSPGCAPPPPPCPTGHALADDGSCIPPGPRRLLILNATGIMNGRVFELPLRAPHQNFTLIMRWTTQQTPDFAVSLHRADNTCLTWDRGGPDPCLVEDRTTDSLGNFARANVTDTTDQLPESGPLQLRVTHALPLSASPGDRTRIEVWSSIADPATSEA